MANMLYNHRQGKECARGCCRTLPKDKRRRNYHGILRREARRWKAEVRTT
jgi:hypothetical protein